jgi:hypothetical protein
MAKRIAIFVVVLALAGCTQTICNYDTEGPTIDVYSHTRIIRDPTDGCEYVSTYRGGAAPTGRCQGPQVCVQVPLDKDGHSELSAALAKARGEQ